MVMLSTPPDVTMDEMPQEYTYDDLSGSGQYLYALEFGADPTNPVRRESLSRITTTNYFAGTFWIDHQASSC
jgi:hypothetical protein